MLLDIELFDRVDKQPLNDSRCLHLCYRQSILVTKTLKRKRGRGVVSTFRHVLVNQLTKETPTCRQVWFLV